MRTSQPPQSNTKCPSTVHIDYDFTKLIHGYKHVVYMPHIRITRKELTRIGSCLTRKCTSSEEVVQNVLYYFEHQDEVQLQTHRNQSESFATACTSRASLVAKNPAYPETDDSKHRVKYFSHKIHPDNLKPGDHIYAYSILATKFIRTT